MTEEAETKQVRIEGLNDLAKQGDGDRLTKGKVRRKRLTERWTSSKFSATAGRLINPFGLTMIFRLTQKLNSKLKAGALPPLPLDENPFADWSANLFLADRTQYILLSNTKSLYSTVMFGKGVTNDNDFIVRSLSTLREFMEDDGLAFIYHRFIAPASGKVSFSKALNRNVTGSMNELVMHATAWLVEDDLSPHAVGFKLNDLLLSAIASSKASKYGKPREEFKRLADNRGAE